MAEKKGKTMALGRGLGDKGMSGIDFVIPNKARKKDSTSTEKNVSRETSQTSTKKKSDKTASTASKKKDDKEQLKAEVMININLIEPNKNQPRKEFNEKALNELAESIKQFGVIQPIILQKREKTYEIIAGERRWRAAKLAGIKEIPAIIKNYTEKEIVEIALIENIQREDLNPIEEALAYKNLIDEYKLTQEELADRISKSRTAITNTMRLLKLCDNVQQMLIDGQLSGGHARALIAVEDEKLQYKLALKIFDDRLSVRETEKLVKTVLEKAAEDNSENEKKSEQDVNIEAIYKDYEERIKNLLGTKVKIKRKDNNTGKIEINYYSSDELERLYEIFSRGN